MRVGISIHRSIAFIIVAGMVFFCIAFLNSNTSAIKYFESENRTDYEVGNNPWSLCYGDFDEDNDLDIAVGNSDSASVGILNNDGHGNFNYSNEYPVRDSAVSVFTSYIDDDDYLDLVICNGDSIYITIYFNDGHGGFINRTDVWVDGNPGHATGGDFDNDGDIDIAICSSGDIFTPFNWTSVLINDGNGSFNSPVRYEVDESPFTIASADFNQDGFLDLATANYMGRSISVLINDGTGSFLDHIDYEAGHSLQFLVTGDFDGDNYPDIATSGMKIFINDGAGSFLEYVRYGKYYDIFLYPGDIDSDGDQDLITTSYNGDPVLNFYGNDGEGQFEYRVSYKTGRGPSELLVSNFDKNSHMDIAVASAYEDIVSIYLNNFKPISVIETEDLQMVLQDTEIELVGNGYDEDIIKEYKWTSDIDGVLGDETKFNISSLSLENHTISFKIRDQHNIWSEEDTINILIHTQPEAYIKNIYPKVAELDKNITFEGRGTDDGHIVAYYWNSDIVGYLSNKETFTTNRLPVGNHTISLTVQDDCGVWSLPYNETITIMAPSSEPETPDIISQESYDIYFIILFVVMIIILILSLVGERYLKRDKSGKSEPSYEVVTPITPIAQSRIESVTCPTCNNIFQVNRTGYPVNIQCPYCGQQGSLR